MSLTTKLTLVAALLVILASAVTVRCALRFFGAQFEEGAARDQFALVHSVAEELDLRVASAQREVCAVASSIPAAMARSPRALAAFLTSRRDLAASFPGGSFYVSPRGEVLAVTCPEDRGFVGRDVSYRPYFHQAVTNRAPYISDPFPSVRDGHPVVVFSVPVHDDRGAVAGVLCCRLDLLKDNIMAGVLKQKPQARRHFYLFNGDGQIIMHRDATRIASLKGAQRGELLRRAALAAGKTIQYPGDDGEPVLGSFARLPSTGWILAAEAPLAEVCALSLETRRLVLATLFVVLVASLTLLWLFVRRLTAPLLLVARSVEGMSGVEGGYRPIPVEGSDEIGVLAAAFNRMIVEVGEQQAALQDEKGFSEQLLLNTAVPSFVIDAESRVIIWNMACEELTGVAAGEVVGGDHAWRAFYPTRRPLLAEVVVQGALWEMADLYDRYSESPLVKEGLRTEGWFQLRGKARYLSVDAAPIRDSSGRIIAAIETLQDVTGRKRKEEELQRMVAAIAESEERYRRLVELSLDGIVLLVGRLFVYANSAGCDILGAAAPDILLGERMETFVERDSLELFEEQLRYVEQNCQSSPWLEQRLVRSDRSTIDVELGVSPFVYEGKEALQVIFRDITERKLAKARLETLAHYDCLTSLPNRVLFFDRLSHAVEESKRHDYPLALLFLDLDGFKEVNDSLGHDAGDAVLVAVGQRLKECVRSCDMVARMGGDEFTVILSKLAAEQDAALVAERILGALGTPFEVSGELRTVGASIGICLYPGGAADVEEIVSHADSAMYQVKQAGANGYCYYGGSMVLRGGRCTVAGRQG